MNFSVAAWAKVHLSICRGSFGCQFTLTYFAAPAAK